MARDAECVDQVRGLLLIANGRVDVGADQPRDLDGGEADAPAAAVNQDRLEVRKFC